MSEYGNVTAAAAAAGSGRSTLYDWRAEDPDFAQAWEEALELGICGLEDEAKRRAMNGSDTLLMFVIKQYRPEYCERQTVDLNAKATEDLRKVPIEELHRQLREFGWVHTDLPAEPAPISAGTAVALVEPPQTKPRGR